MKHEGHGDLAGSRILICRPHEDARALAAQLHAKGAACKVLPCLRIDPLVLAPQHKQHLLDLDHYHKIIAVSQHAAKLALEQIDHYWPQLPIQQQWYAIGRKTAAILNDWPVPGLQIPAHDLDSETLLELDTLQHIEGQRTLLLKGLGGRETIADTLRSRGARVDELALYQRSRPDYSELALRAALIDFNPNMIIALSAETVLNLQHLARTIDASLAQCKLFVPSVRVAKVARDLNFQLTYVLEDFSADALLDAQKQSNYQDNQNNNQNIHQDSQQRDRK